MRGFTLPNIVPLDDVYQHPCKRFKFSKIYNIHCIPDYIELEIYILYMYMFYLFVYIAIFTKSIIYYVCENSDQSVTLISRPSALYCEQF